MQRRLSNNATESEKSLERRLVKKVREAGGACLKYYNPCEAGYPDRLCLLPGGRVFWVELKSKGRQLAPLQMSRARQLWAMGFKTHVADSPEAVDAIVEYYATGLQ